MHTVSVLGEADTAPVLLAAAEPFPLGILTSRPLKPLGIPTRSARSVSQKCRRSCVQVIGLRRCWRCSKALAVKKDAQTSEELRLGPPVHGHVVPADEKLPALER